jgi:DnaJ-class molecular chaperone
MNDKTTEGTKKPSRLKPAQLPIKCPLCDGWGTFSYGSKICNGCKGKGWVLVPAEERINEKDNF